MPKKTAFVIVFIVALLISIVFLILTLLLNPDTKQYLASIKTFNSNLFFKKNDLKPATWGYQEDVKFVSGDKTIFITGVLINKYQQGDYYWVKVAVPRGYLDILISTAGEPVGFGKAIAVDKKNNTTVLDRTVEWKLADTKEFFRNDLSTTLGKPVALNLNIWPDVDTQNIYYQSILNNHPCTNKPGCKLLVEEWIKNAEESFSTINKLEKGWFVYNDKLALPVNYIAIP